MSIDNFWVLRLFRTNKSVKILKYFRFELFFGGNGYSFFVLNILSLAGPFLKDKVGVKT